MMNFSLWFHSWKKNPNNFYPQECLENNYLLYSSLNIFCDFIIEGASRLKEWVRVVRNLRKKKENELAARPTNPL